MTQNKEQHPAQKAMQIDGASIGEDPKSARSSWLIASQKFLGVAGLIAFLTLANILIPFSVDIYTPALPQLPGYFGTSEGVVNLTLVGFYISFAVSLFVFGGLSDKTGRKPILIAGNLIYVFASVICAFSGSIELLIAARVGQAFGAGAVCAVATALVSDCFAPAKRATIFTVMQVLFVVGPILAPLLGGFIILFGTWREVFLVLAGLGLICLIASLFYEESLDPQNRSSKGLLGSITGALAVCDNVNFLLILGVMSLFNFFFMGYIAAGAYIYVDIFGVTQQQFTYFFAGSAAVSALGPLTFQRVRASVNIQTFTTGAIISTALVGVAIILVGQSSVWLFAAFTVLVCMTTMTIRPYTIDMMLALNPQRVGAASSLLNFISTVFGSLGMVAVMLFDNLIVGLGVLVVAGMVLSLPLWLLNCKRAATSAK